MDRKYTDWLTQLTVLPTAAGREDAVIQWVHDWARRRRSCRVTRDRYGNIVIDRAPRNGGGRRGGRRTGGRAPIYFTAHMDHPAFVVEQAIDDRHAIAAFRGGVRDEYFAGSRVLLHPTNPDGGSTPVRGRVEAFEDKPAPSGDKRVRIRFTGKASAQPGDIITWDTGAPGVKAGLFHAPACDDLSGVAAALAAFDQLGRAPADRGRDVKVLLTRCEEVGFIGAIGACKSRILPKDARLIALENSKSFAESPIGEGPVVRVGDRMSTFDPDLTFRVGLIAQQLAARDESFKYQRKLMPGGVCEASAYQVYGHRATCVCLALGNYHNMDEQRRRIAPEFISLADYHHLVRLLVEIGKTLDEQGVSGRSRLEKLFESRRALIE